MSTFNRIAILLPSLNGGGAERSLLKLAIGLKERGFGVDLVLVHRAGQLEEEIPGSLRIVDLNSPRAFTSRALSSTPALAGYLRRERPEVLFTGLMTNLVALWARRLARVDTRVVISERNILSVEVKQFPRDIRFRLMPWLVKTFYPAADGIVAVSRAVATDIAALCGLPAERIMVIYNPVITPQVKEKATFPASHPWFAAGQPPVILSVGRLVPQKDYPTLMRAFARIIKTQPVRLAILGEGVEREKLERLAKELGIDHDLWLPGFVDNPYPYMKRASVFVLPSEFEGLPGVIIEALFCGVPVVATDCPGGSREVLADGAYGQLVPVGDSAAMAQAIENYLAGKAATNNAECWEDYEQERVLDQYIAYFSGIWQGSH